MIGEEVIAYYGDAGDGEELFEKSKLVRCKDCKHRYVTGVTTQYYVCDFMNAEYRDDGYCHRGERIENE